MRFTTPTRMDPYIEEFAEDQKQAMIRRLGDAPNRRVVDEINALTTEKIVIDTLKNSLIEWKKQKNALQMRADLEAADSSIVGDLE